MSETTNVGSVFASEMAKSDSPAKLEGTAETKAAGEFVLKGMELATKEGFGHVAKVWYKKTMSFEQGLEQIAKDRENTVDVMATLQEIKPAVNDAGKFVMRHKDGQEFRPTEHAITQMGGKAGTGTWYVESLLSNPLTPNKKREAFKRDRGDAEALVVAIANGFRRLDQSKKFLWRTRKDGSLRAMLTERYAIIDNEWFVRKLAEFIPGGRLSHWKGDSDTLYGNVLIPDTIREEKDSDYGGMTSVGNSEIGVRRVSSRPSIFRAICMNGCIWGQTKGQDIRQVHRGEINLESLALEIKENLNKQIPLLPQGIDKFLNTRTYAWDGMSVKPVFAQLVKDEGEFTKKQAAELLKAHAEERAIVPDYALTLFGLANAITRAGQKGTPAEWVKFDEIGGRVASYSKDDFEHLIEKARKMKAKDVDEVFA
jgi:hypothetical protein